MQQQGRRGEPARPAGGFGVKACGGKACTGTARPACSLSVRAVVLATLEVPAPSGATTTAPTLCVPGNHDVAAGGVLMKAASTPWQSGSLALDPRGRNHYLTCALSTVHTQALHPRAWLVPRRRLASGALLQDVG